VLAVVAPDVLAFVRAALPPAPARVLEIGAGSGELAAALRAGGHDVTAIDPAAEDGTGVERAALIEVRGSFDAALAVVSLHHVEPLEASCAHLATLVRPGAATSTRSPRSGRRCSPTSTSASPSRARTCTAGTCRRGCATPRSA
jgi:2-polyprenyl-3-methyl-5-hydroxy-6-metoxy-1,4-benzoquinol methylase